MAHIAPWFPEAKFGVFVHWILLSAVEPDAWDGEDWPAMAAHFTAARYDPKAWAANFASWGAQYAVLTTRHVGDFFLYDHPANPFSAPQSSPAGRDLVAPFVAAMREAGLKVGLYSNLAVHTHPDWCDPEQEPERWARYVTYLHDQVRHLCTAYGKIDLLWFDSDWERSAAQWRTPELVEIIETLQPGIILNNRLRHAALGHFSTPEQSCPLAPREGWWELCDTFADAWWYDPREAYKPTTEIVRIFGDVLGMGGNYLMNVSPLGDGTIPPEQAERLEGLGAWITAHAEAVYGTEAGLPPGLFNGASTHRGNTLYLLAYDQPRPDLVVKGLCSPVKRVTHLATGTELSFRWSGGHAEFKDSRWLYVTLPQELNDAYATVVKVEFAEAAEFQTPEGKRVRWR